MDLVGPRCRALAVVAALVATLPGGCRRFEDRRVPGPAHVAPLGPSLVRGPYLQLVTAQRATVRWRTDAPGPGVLLLGRSPGPLSKAVVDARLAVDHEVSITGLEPLTTYVYRVGTSAELPTLDAGAGPAIHVADSAPTFTFTTAPTPGAPQPTRVWVLGDAGTANDNAAAVRDAYLKLSGGRVPDLWLMLGDNAYTRGTDVEYQRAVFDMFPSVLARSPLWSTRGNHEVDGAGTGSTYYDVFTLPAAGEAGGAPSGTEAYYSFDWANVHFVCLDSFGSDRTPQGAMARWLREDLASTAQPWIVAFFHHPPYSKGTHDSDREVELVEMREHIVPILEAGGVDLVLSGHSHGYERSYLLAGHYGLSTTFTRAFLKQAGSGREEAEGAYRKPALRKPKDGAVYVVSGASGQVGRFDAGLDHPAMFISLRRLGSLVIDVAGPRLDVKYLDEAGSFDDFFTLRKP